MLKKLLLLLFIPLLLCGCTDKSRTEITYSSWGSITEVGITKKIIEDFEKENPEIKIKFMHIPQNYFQKIHLLLASNTAPDVIFINNLNLPVYEAYLMDLRSYFTTDDFYPQALRGLSYNNKLLAIPRDLSNILFYVNTDMVKLPQKNWKIEELITKTVPKGSFVVSYEDYVFWLMPYLKYFGGGVLDENLNLIINNTTSKKAIEFYKDLKNKYHIAPQKSEVGSSTLAQMFIDEKIAFYLSGRWMYPKISETAKFNWAVINFPYGISPQPCDTSGWAVSKSTKNKDASIKFVKYLSSKTALEYYTKSGLIVPARKSVSQLLNSDNHNEKVFLEIIEHSENTPVSKNYKKLTDKLNKELDL